MQEELFRMKNNNKGMDHLHLPNLKMNKNNKKNLYFKFEIIGLEISLEIIWIM